jgi:hypothetical protein
MKHIVCRLIVHRKNQEETKKGEQLILLGTLNKVNPLQERMGIKEKFWINMDGRKKCKQIDILEILSLITLKIIQKLHKIIIIVPND